MTKSLVMAGCAAALALGSCAAPAGPPAYFAQSSGPACFRADQVYAFTRGPDRYVDLQTAQGPFRARLGPNCPDFSWMMEIGVRPVDSSWLCAGKPDQLITAYQTQFSRCSISEIRPLMPAPLPG